jgi:hypothetical protein
MDVKTIVSDLGGATEVARLCGLKSSQAVSMWISRGKLPDSWLRYLRVIRPDVFVEKVGAGETATEKTGTD